MADHAVLVHSAFDASHQIEDDPLCGRDHGHTFHVTACVEGILERDESSIWRVFGTEDLQQRLDSVTRELDLRDLNAMMPGSTPIPETIAAWILERITDADYVEVEMGWRRLTGRASRNKKR